MKMRPYFRYGRGVAGREAVEQFLRLAFELIEIGPIAEAARR